MSVMGLKIKQFDVPVCNSFKAKVLRNQICYEVDANKYVHNCHLVMKKLSIH